MMSQQTNRYTYYKFKAAKEHPSMEWPILRKCTFFGGLEVMYPRSKWREWCAGREVLVRVEMISESDVAIWMLTNGKDE